MVESELSCGQTFLRIVETHVLPSLAAKEYFQRNPFSSRLSENDLPPVDSPFAYGFLHEVVVPFMEALATNGDDSTLITCKFLKAIDRRPADVWTTQGLGAMVQKAHCQWREGYIQGIRQIIDTALKEEGPFKNRLSLARKLFTCTELDCPGRGLSYATLQKILMKISVCQERGTDNDQQQGMTAGRAGSAAPAAATTASAATNHNENLTVVGNGDMGGVSWGRGINNKNKKMNKAPNTNPFLCQMLRLDQIRDVFSMGEEAFILMVIRKHLRHQFGSRVFAAEVILSAGAADPSMMMMDWVGGTRVNEGNHQPNHGEGDDVTAVVPALNEDDFFVDEVVASDTMQVDDARYYRLLKEALEMFDTLKESSSVLADMHTIFPVTHEPCFTNSAGEHNGMTMSSKGKHTYQNRASRGGRKKRRVLGVSTGLRHRAN